MATLIVATNRVDRNNMSKPLLWLLIIIPTITGQELDGSASYRKYVYQKDMSEYCRRRVMPSVFLSRHIVDANAQMLHFSRLEVPYSCNINVRTDMGSNIIVVIQVFTDVDLKAMCRQSDSQLLIYELGETFGGYWGMVPDSVMKQQFRRKERQYTLTPSQTTPTTTTTESSTSTTTTRTTTRRSVQSDRSEENQQEYVELEVPILNLTARLIPGEQSGDSALTTEDNFDLIYDVAPWNGDKYETKELPIIEVSVEKTKKGKLRVEGASHSDERASHSNAEATEFVVQFEDLFTPDPRLTIPAFDDRSPRRNAKFHHSVNTRLDFKKNKKLLAAKEALLNTKRLFNFREPQPNKLYEYLQSPTPHDNNPDEKNNNWDVINDILKNLTNSKEKPTEPPHKELANFLRSNSMKGNSKSAYLNPDMPDYLKRPGGRGSESSITLDRSSEQTTFNISHLLESDDTLGFTNVSQDFNKSSNRSNVLDGKDSANYNVGARVALRPIALDVDTIILNGTNENKTGVQYKPSEATLKTGATTTMKKLDPLTVPLVNHESWDNLVNAAPVIAVKLNETVAGDSLKKEDGQIRTPRLRRRRARKKRYMHAINIEVASPHRVQILKHVTTTAAPEKFDMRDFQRLIELQDDEIHGRMAMRYLKQFVGLPLLKLCDFNETFSRHVYLFNSSRLVLALSNFTLNRMTIVVTPARTLLNTEARCAPAHLECQVSGARVCIDAHSACDGVPNCGSYDIYDEDRLSCGAAAGLRHNVCLAAITFLAVLLTVLYTIHYWLKRCIPKVSDAFFIYTDAAENVMYLEPLMRSPHDVGTGKQEYYSAGMQPYMEYEDIIPKKNRCKTFFRRCIAFLRCRRKRHASNDVVDAELDNLYPQRLSNFPEMDLGKMPSDLFFGQTVDVGVQTTSSLEIGVLNLASSYSQGEYEPTRVTESLEHIVLMEDDLDSNQPYDELNILQFFRRERSKSTSSHINRFVDDLNEPNMSRHDHIYMEEQEIGTHVYNPEHYASDQVLMPVRSTDMAAGKKPEIVRKHLRFREETTVIPFEEDDDDENGEIAPGSSKRGVLLGASRVFRLQDVNNETNEVEETTGTREFKSYFNWGKERKKKKPKKK